MFVLLWTTVVFVGVLRDTGVSAADADRCVSRGVDDPGVFTYEYCSVTKREVNLLCSSDEVVVLTSVQVAVKSNRDICMNRILGAGNEICCRPQTNDELYDSHCLQDVWNMEDRVHYQAFITNILKKCSNVSQCVLDEHMFTNLQRRIPGSKTYSSYFQVLHQCITVPPNRVNMCSSKTATKNEIHLQTGFNPGAEADKTCSCRVTSQSGGAVFVKAVDVRTAHSELMLSSDKDVKNISHRNLPLFGFQEVLLGRNINLSVRSGLGNAGDTIWLHVSGSDGQDVSVVCGDQKFSTETTPRAVRISTVPVSQSVDKYETDVSHFIGHWPLIYIAAGSLFTLVLFGCVVGGILICRQCRKKEKKRDHPYGCPSEFHHDPMNESHYATVPDVYPHMPDPRMTGSLYRQRIAHDKRLERSAESPYMHGHRAAHASQLMNPGPPSDVSQLEAFLECKEPRQSDRPQGESALDSRDSYGFTDFSRR